MDQFAEMNAAIRDTIAAIRAKHRTASAEVEFIDGTQLGWGKWDGEWGLLLVDKEGYTDHIQQSSLRFRVAVPQHLGRLMEAIEAAEEELRRDVQNATSAYQKFTQTLQQE